MEFVPKTDILKCNIEALGEHFPIRNRPCRPWALFHEQSQIFLNSGIGYDIDVP
jgi:hypothetical protein